MFFRTTILLITVPSEGRRKKVALLVWMNRCNGQLLSEVGYGTGSYSYG